MRGQQNTTTTSSTGTSGCRVYNDDRLDKQKVSSYIVNGLSFPQKILGLYHIKSIKQEQKKITLGPENHEKWRF